MNIRFLIAQAAPYRGQIAVIAMLGMLNSLVVLAIPWLAGQVFGGLLSEFSPNLTATLLFLILALTFLAALAILLGNYANNIAERILADLRVFVFERVQSLKMEFHDQHDTGDLVALTSVEVSKLSRFISGTMSQIPATVLTAIGAMTMLVWLDPVLGWLIPLLVPTFFITMKLIGRRLRGLASAGQAAEARVMAKASETLAVIQAIKSFNREKAQGKSYKSLVEEVRDINVREGRVYAFLGPLSGLVTAVATVLLIFFTSRNLASGAMGPSELFSFLLYAALLTRPIGSAANFYGQVQSAQGVLNRLQDVLNEPVDNYTNTPLRQDTKNSQIEFEDVTFAYPGRSEVFSHTSFSIEPAKTVVITGKNGSGKTTIASLLLGFYSANEGRILLGGQDISSLPVASVRKMIGYVPQRSLLISGTVFDNIAFGLEGASRQQIEAAAEAAQASSFISKLPNGYSTQIGDGGARLSGGQRQRIALARALIKDPGILILDEATSMFDIEGETDLIDSCQQIFAERTTIIITHRPRFLEIATQVLEVSDGTVFDVTRKEKQMGARSQS